MLFDLSFKVGKCFGHTRVWTLVCLQSSDTHGLHHVEPTFDKWFHACLSPNIYFRSTGPQSLFMFCYFFQTWSFRTRSWERLDENRNITKGRKKKDEAFLASQTQPNKPFLPKIPQITLWPPGACPPESTMPIFNLSSSAAFGKLPGTRIADGCPNKFGNSFAISSEIRIHANYEYRGIIPPLSCFESYLSHSMPKSR